MNLLQTTPPDTVPVRSGSGAPAAPPNLPAAITVDKLNFYYGAKRALEDISIQIPANLVTAFIGPSGCGKSTFLRTLNRMNDIIAGTRVEGGVKIDGRDIYAAGDRRRRAAPPRRHGVPEVESVSRSRSSRTSPTASAHQRAGAQPRGAARTRRGEPAQAAIWDEVKDRLHESALALSGGQQQRLCIARALAVKPDVLLMDEPASALDPIATQRIEELIYQLKTHYTIVIVTHNMQQAARVSDQTAFFWLGGWSSSGRPISMFTNPRRS